jgi:hypothetical protein
MRVNEVDILSDLLHTHTQNEAIGTFHLLTFYTFPAWAKILQETTTNFQI